jgi:hypothetical protein
MGLDPLCAPILFPAAVLSEAMQRDLPRLCVDAPGFDRAVFHQDFNAKVQVMTRAVRSKVNRGNPYLTHHEVTACCLEVIQASDWASLQWVDTVEKVGRDNAEVRLGVSIWQMTGLIRLLAGPMRHRHRRPHYRLTPHDSRRRAEREPRENR